MKKIAFILIYLILSIKLYSNNVNLGNILGLYDQIYELDSTGGATSYYINKAEMYQNSAIYNYKNTYIIDAFIYDNAKIINFDPLESLVIENLYLYNMQNYQNIEFTTLNNLILYGNNDTREISDIMLHFRGIDAQDKTTKITNIDAYYNASSEEERSYNLITENINLTIGNSKVSSVYLDILKVEGNYFNLNLEKDSSLRIFDYESLSNTNVEFNIKGDLSFISSAEVNLENTKIFIQEGGFFSGHIALKGFSTLEINSLGIYSSSRGSGLHILDNSSVINKGDIKIAVILNSSLLEIKQAGTISLTGSYYANQNGKTIFTITPETTNENLLTANSIFISSNHIFTFNADNNMKEGTIYNLMDIKGYSNGTSKTINDVIPTRHLNLDFKMIEDTSGGFILNAYYCTVGFQEVLDFNAGGQGCSDGSGTSGGDTGGTDGGGTSGGDTGGTDGGGTSGGDTGGTDGGGTSGGDTGGTDGGGTSGGDTGGTDGGGTSGGDTGGTDGGGTSGGDTGGTDGGGTSGGNTGGGGTSSGGGGTSGGSIADIINEKSIQGLAIHINRENVLGLIDAFAQVDVSSADKYNDVLQDMIENTYKGILSFFNITNSYLPEYNNYMMIYGESIISNNNSVIKNFLAREDNIDFYINNNYLFQNEIQNTANFSFIDISAGLSFNFDYLFNFLNGFNIEYGIAFIDNLYSNTVINRLGANLVLSNNEDIKLIVGHNIFQNQYMTEIDQKNDITYEQHISKIFLDVQLDGINLFLDNSIFWRHQYSQDFFSNQLVVKNPNFYNSYVGGYFIKYDNYYDKIFEIGVKYRIYNNYSEVKSKAYVDHSSYVELSNADVSKIKIYGEYIFLYDFTLRASYDLSGLYNASIYYQISF